MLRSDKYCYLISTLLLCKAFLNQKLILKSILYLILPNKHGIFGKIKYTLLSVRLLGVEKYKLAKNLKDMSDCSEVKEEEHA